MAGPQSQGDLSRMRSSRPRLGLVLVFTGLAGIHALLIATGASFTTDEVYSSMAADHPGRYAHMPVFQLWLSATQAFRFELWIGRMLCALPFLASLPFVAWWLRDLLPARNERLTLIALLGANAFLITEVANLRYQGLLWACSIAAAMVTRGVSHDRGRGEIAWRLIVIALPSLVHPGALPLTLGLAGIVTWPRWRNLSRRHKGRVIGVLAVLSLACALPWLCEGFACIRDEGWDVFRSRLPIDVAYSRARPAPEALLHGFARLTGLDPWCADVPQPLVYGTVLAVSIGGLLVLQGQRGRSTVGPLLVMFTVQVVYLLASPVLNAFHPRYYLFASLPHAVFLVLATRALPQSLRSLGLLAALLIAIAAHPGWRGLAPRLPLEPALRTAERMGIEEIWVTPGHWRQPLMLWCEREGIPLRLRGLHWDGRDFPRDERRNRWILDGRTSRPGQRHHRLVPEGVEVARDVASWSATRAAWYQQPRILVRLRRLETSPPEIAGPANRR